MSEPKRLDQFAKGSTVTITGLCDCSKARARLCAMGLTPGTTVVVESNGSGPRRLRVRGSNVVIGQGLCSKIMACPSDEISPPQNPAHDTGAEGHCICGDHSSGRR